MGSSENSLTEAASYDQYFEENYETLRRWALHITKYDRELAEDLVHDVYLRFIVTGQNPKKIDNLENYVFISLKNRNLSDIRRSSRTAKHSAFNDEITDSTVLAYDPRPVNEVHDQLRAICHYACLRRETSIGAIILILIFFHGFSTREVALILRRSINAIDCRLAVTRREINTFLAIPHKKISIPEKDTSLFSQARVVDPGSSIQSELQQLVFSTRKGSCMTLEDIHIFYKTRRGELSHGALNHLVSCEACLRNTSVVLGFTQQVPERNPDIREKIFSSFSASA